MRKLNQDKKQSWFTWALRGFLAFGFLILSVRLFELQIIKGSYFRSLSDENRIRRISITAARGKIFARGGEELVANSEIKKRIEFKKSGGYIKVTDLGNAKPEEVITEPERIYPLGDKFSHISGYLSEVNSSEVSKVDPNCLDRGERKLGNLTGRTGLEEEYDCDLRGVDGEALIEVDSMGRFVRLLGLKEPIFGSDIHTTIDIGIQKKAAEALGDKKGAVVVSDGRGQILAMYSSPSFDPTNISSGLSNPDLPFFNRSISGTFHPGSVFKIVTATAALEDHKIDRNFTYDDEGIIKIGDFSYTNWYFTQYGGREGVINLVKGIARSTDTMFYKLGEMVGVDRLAFWARKFGLSKPLGIDLPGESAGIVPDPKWKNDVKGERWFLGNTYHMAIGQGDLTATPLQANIITSVVANGGKFCRPYLNSKLSIDCTDLGISKETLEIVKEGMVGACSSGGTAFPFFDFKPQIACKTGTAETEEKDKTHAWFSAFGPTDNPQIVVTVIVEKGGEGSVVAAPIARKIFDYWNLRNNP